MQTSWFIRKNGVVHGPASFEILKNLLDTGRISLSEEAGQSKDGPWNPLGEYAEFAPTRPISELFAAPPAAPPEPPAAAPQHGSSPTAARLVASVLNGGAGTLSPNARSEFEQSYTAEFRKSIDNKAMPASLVVAGLTLILLAAVSMIFGFVAAFITGGITYGLVKSSLEKKHLQAMTELSDEMLVTRYNEAKADQRAAKTRSAIGWAVFAIIVVILLIAILASRSPR